MASMKDREILVVDDAADVRVLARKILESDGARILEAESVDAGIALAKEKSPHLVLLDLEMPGKMGFDFLTFRKEDDVLKEVPVIILSGKKDKESVSQAVMLGANDYVLKPFRTTLLLQKVRKALRLTSFLKKTFEPKDAPEATFLIAAEILKISEGGCQLETAVKLGIDRQIKITGEIFDSLEIQDVVMKVSSKRGVCSSNGRYTNEINFVGMNEARAKKVRARLKEAK